MRILLTSDMHWHCFREFDSLLENGKSLRLSLYEKTIQYIKEYCKNNKINTIIDGGDIFHSRESISIPVLDAIGRSFNDLCNCGVNIYFLKGNHDTSNKIGDITSLQVLKKFGKIITKIEYAKIEGIVVAFYPWDDSFDLKTEINNRDFANLIIGHRMVKGAKHLGSILEGEELQGLDKSKFDYMFLGHVHEHQKVEDKIYYIGSTISSNFSEKNQQAGFLVYDTELKTFEFIENPYSPKFIQKKLNKEQLEQYANNPPEYKENEFVELKITLDKKEKIEIPQLKNTRVSIISQSSEENRIDNIDGITPESLLLKFKEQENLSEDIYNIGLEILRESK